MGRGSVKLILFATTILLLAEPVSVARLSATFTPTRRPKIKKAMKIDTISRTVLNGFRNRFIQMR